ncbi:MAG: hypothetical protein ACF8XB_06240 [Planctomycetota bacterium JB042]
MRQVVAFDTETTLIGPGNVAPRVICVSLAARDEDGDLDVGLYGNGDDLEDLCRWLFEDKETFLVGHNVAFDMAAIARTFPHLLPLIWKAIEDGRVTDTGIREKLLNISTTGRVDKREMPDGSKKAILYSLAALAADYLGVDLAGDKDGDDIWRLHYSMLDGKKAEDYPEDAARYAKDDARHTLLVYEGQEDRIETRDGAGPGSVATETFQTGVDFALKLSTACGLKIDPAKRDEIAAMLDTELAPDRLNLLVESGILRPGQPPRPYKNGATDADGNPRMTKGKKESVDKKKLQARVKSVCENLGRPVLYTEPTEKFPEGQVSTESDILADLAEHDEVLEQYAHRQSLQKIVQELRKLDGDRCYPNFNVLVESGRTSSYGNSKSRPALYPSVNIQQQDPRVRGMYVADDGWLLGSCDYSSLELVSLAQKTYSLFGQSKLRDLINDGNDPHAYLGSQLAFYLDEDFRESCREVEASDPMDVYRAFLSLKESESEEVRAFFKHYRTFAKPVGLGYPGGLGPDTLCKLAKKAYGIDVEPMLARQLKEIWFDTFPEMRAFFEWVNSCGDPRNPDRYAYSTPLGMYRAGATYCAACNGSALQSPSAEGAKLAHFNVVRACSDPTLDSILLGCFAPGFIHDEILFLVPDDDLASERALEVSEIMVGSMRQILPDVRIEAEPCLMRRWSKSATPVFDPSGKLVVWEEPAKEKEGQK